METQPYLLIYTRSFFRSGWHHFTCYLRQGPLDKRVLNDFSPPRDGCRRSIANLGVRPASSQEYGQAANDRW